MLTILITAALFAAPADTAKPATNTKCPVTGEAITTKSVKNMKTSTAVVKGQTYNICCPSCGPMMQKNPDKYLNGDGTPKNAK